MGRGSDRRYFWDVGVRGHPRILNSRSTPDWSLRPLKLHSLAPVY